MLTFTKFGINFSSIIAMYNVESKLARFVKMNSKVVSCSFVITHSAVVVPLSLYRNKVLFLQNDYIGLFLALAMVEAC